MGTGDLLRKYLKRSFAVGVIGAIVVTVSDKCYGIGLTQGLPMPLAPNSSISDSEMMAGNIFFPLLLFFLSLLLICHFFFLMKYVAVDVILVDKCYLEKYELSHGDIAILG